ncbi:MAG: undecaprenyl-phosphate glucose phosphotransferase [Lachnospiraceae bacterium]|nr:undecaprenyl-phosphate glucose phosphotransferase [Lachnospiraceae bacterium]
MIKDNQKYFNYLHVVLDAITIIISYIVGWWLKFKSGIFEEVVWAYTFWEYMRPLFLMVPGLLILYSAFNLYAPKRVQGRRLEIWNLFKANTLGMLIFMSLSYLLKDINLSRWALAIFYVLNMVMGLAVRSLIRRILKGMRKRGLNQKHLLLVGYSRAAEEYIDRVLLNPQWGYTIRGILDDNVPAGTTYKGIKVLGSIDNLMFILPENRLDEIAITLGLNDYSRLEEIVTLCEKSGVHTKFIPDYNNIIPTKPYTEDILGLPVINIRYVPLSNSFPAAVKRLMDIVGSLVCIALFLPVMLISAAIIKLTSPGPIIFKQERVGLHNRTFQMFKFRSMVVQNEQTEKKAWTVKDDPRVTKFGKFMRKTSIDELPQLFNILKGDMSLVGPRPERPFFVEKFQEEIPRYMVKHQVRPGLTGWAQVNGYRGDTSIRKRIDHDLYYIENWTLGLDIKILFLTVFKGFVNKNAY